MTATTPKVSLLVTAYNAGPLLGEALQSALDQRGAPPFEVVVFDDGSTDDTWKIAHEFADANLGVFRLARTERNVGRAKALIKAREHARGEYIGWLDADDILEPDALRLTVDRLDSKPELGFVATRCWMMSADGKETWGWKPGDCELTWRQLSQRHVAHHFRLCRASVYDEAGGPNPDFVAAVDYDLTLRMGLIAPFERVPKRLYRWRQRPGSISRKFAAEQKAFMDKARAEAVLAKMRQEGRI